MSSAIGSNFFNYDYLLRNCYSSNRSARKSGNRGSYSNGQLLAADSDALRKISKNLQEITYDKEKGKEIYNNIKAFSETYNNVLSSSKGSSSRELDHHMKKLKAFVKDNKSALESIGIKVSSSGKIEVKKKDLLENTAEKIERVFNETNGFSKEIEKFAKQIHKISKKVISEEEAQKRILEARQSSAANVSGDGSAGNTTNGTHFDAHA